MLSCLTYVAFVYWAVIAVHTLLPIEVAICGLRAEPGSFGFGSFLGNPDTVQVDQAAWEGFPCDAKFPTKVAFILRRPHHAVNLVMSGGGQDEPFVPVLFVVPLIFFASCILRWLSLPCWSFQISKMLLKLGIAVGCRGAILARSLADPTFESVYYKRYAKIEFFIMAYTAWVVEIPTWHEALVSGGTMALIVANSILFPQYVEPSTSAINVALQATAATAVGVAYALYRERKAMALTRAAVDRPRLGLHGAGMPGDDGPVKQRHKAQASTSSEAAVAGSDAPRAISSAGAGSSAGTTAVAAASATTTVATTLTSARLQAPLQGEAHAAMPPSEGVATRPVTDAPAAGALDPDAQSAAAAMPSKGDAKALLQSVTTVQRITARCGKPYRSPVAPYRVSLKINHAHLADVPGDLLTHINQRMLAAGQRSYQAVSIAAREGCLELVLDLRPVPAPGGALNDMAEQDELTRHTFLQGLGDTHDMRQRLLRQGTDTGRRSTTAANADGGNSPITVHAFHIRSDFCSDESSRDSGPMADQCDDDVIAPLLLSQQARPAQQPHRPPQAEELARSVVTCLHERGLVCTDKEPSLQVQINGEAMHIDWLPRLQAWRSMPSGALAQRIPEVLSLSPHAAVPSHRGASSTSSSTTAAPTAQGSSSSLELTLVVTGVPESELRSGKGICVRCLGRPLSTAVLSVTPTLVQHSSGSAEEGDDTDGTAAAVAASGMCVRLVVEPVPHSGLLLVEARSSGGLLSQSRPVVLDGCPQLVSELASLASSSEDGSMDALLLDYGTWLEAAASIMQARRSSEEKLRRHRTPPGKAEAAADEAAPGDATNSSGSSTLPPGAKALQADVASYIATLPSGLCWPGMIAIAGDLLAACCEAGLVACADRLIDMVVRCDLRPGHEAYSKVIDHVREGPLGAAPLHLAVAAGSRPLVETLLSWHAKLGLRPGWDSQAAVGVTPLHVAAGLTDGGRMAAWILAQYPEAVPLWFGACAHDGCTPAAMAAGQHKMRLRLLNAWYGSRTVARGRAALAPLWRAFSLALSCPTASQELWFRCTTSARYVHVLALYTFLLLVVGLTAIVRALAARDGHAALAAALVHVPQIIALASWLASVHWGALLAPRAGTASPAAAIGPCHYGGEGGSGSTSWSRLQAALAAGCITRVAVKTAAGLGLWPVAAGLASCGVNSCTGSAGSTSALSYCLAQGGQLVVDGVMLPLLEWVGLPLRIVLLLADVPATALLLCSLHRTAMQQPRTEQQQRPISSPSPSSCMPLVMRALLCGLLALAASTLVAFFIRARFSAAELIGSSSCKGGALASSRCDVLASCRSDSGCPGSSISAPAAPADMQCGSGASSAAAASRMSSEGRAPGTHKAA